MLMYTSMAAERTIWRRLTLLVLRLGDSEHILPQDGLDARCGYSGSSHIRCGCCPSCHYTCGLFAEVSVVSLAYLGQYSPDWRDTQMQ